MSSESSQVRLLLLIHAFEGKKMREGDDLFYLFGRKRTKKKEPIVKNVMLQLFLVQVFIKARVITSFFIQTWLNLL